MTRPTSGWDGHLDDGVVVLSRLLGSDAKAHFAGEDEELVRWLNGGPSSLGGVEDYLVRVAQDWAGEGDPVFHLAIRALGSSAGPGVLMGTLDLQQHQSFLRPDQANLAYGLYAPFRGQGFASRAVLLGLRFLAEQSDVTRAVIRTHPDNHPSAAVALRTGFALVTRAEDEDGMDRWERVV